MSPAGDTEAREWFTVRRYSAGKATRIADDVTPDIYELCSKCNTSFMAFMQKDDASFEAWLKEVGTVTIKLVDGKAGVAHISSEDKGDHPSGPSSRSPTWCTTGATCSNVR